MLKKLFRRRLQLTDQHSVAEKAGLLFDSGLNCAQSVLQATTGNSDPQMLAVCDAFGGGIDGRQCLCGAVAGGVVALGLNGRNGRAGELVDQFRFRNKLTCCKGLSAPFKWSSREHLANCRKLTVTTAEDVSLLLRK